MNMMARPGAGRRTRENLNESWLMEILKYPHPCLKRKAKPLKKLDRDVVQRVEEMFETMVAAHGVGLAGPQVGWEVRLFVINVTGQKADGLLFINPKIMETEGTVTQEEGCLSLPGINAKVRRAEKVRVQAFDVKGQWFELTADGLLAIAVQHENDHLDGKLFISKVTRAGKVLIASKLKDLEEEFASSHPDTPAPCPTQR